MMEGNSNDDEEEESSREDSSEKKRMENVRTPEGILPIEDE